MHVSDEQIPGDAAKRRAISLQPGYESGGKCRHGPVGPRHPRGKEQSVLLIVFGAAKPGSSRKDQGRQRQHRTA
jgi:hypothetical protein